MLRGKLWLDEISLSCKVIETAHPLLRAGEGGEIEHSEIPAGALNS
jgi:hypothetical protein